MQLPRDAEHPGYAEKDDQRAAVPRQVNQLLAVRHRHPPLGAGHNDGLRHLRHRQLGLEHGGGGKSRADAGNDFIIHPVGLQNPHLLQRRAVQGGVAALDAGDGLAGGGGVQRNRHNLRQRHLLAAINPRAGLGKPGNLRRHQRIGVDDDIRPLNNPPRLDGKQLRVARPGADDIDFACVGHR